MDVGGLPPTILKRAREEEASNRERRVGLEEAAGGFARKASQYRTVLEVALCGSMAENDPYPLDLDLAIVIDGFEEMTAIAHSARQMSPATHNWEMFVFAPDRSHLGRICHKKKCPAKVARCRNGDCGKTPFVGNLRGFEFDPAIFLAPDIQILFLKQEPDTLLTWKRELGARSEPPEPLRPLEIRCVECGEPFLFGVGWQKIVRKEGRSAPRHCDRCHLTHQFGSNAAAYFDDVG